MLVIIMGTVAGHLMIMGLLLPVLPLYAKTFGVGDAMLGLVITAFGIGRLLIDIPAGLLAERVGRKLLMFGGPLLIAVASIGCALTESYFWLIVFRFLQGVGAGAYMTAAMVVCADLSTPETRGRIMALYQSALLVGAGAGPAVGGLLAARLGYESVFWLSMVIGLVSATYTLLRARETKQSDRHGESHSLRLFVPILKSPALMIALLVSLGVFMTRSSAFMQLMPLLGNERYQLGPEHIGYGFVLLAAANFLMLPTAGRMVVRYGTMPLVVGACVGLAIGMSLAALANSVVMFFVAMTILGLASGLEGPSLSSYAAAHAPDGRFGPTMGAMRFTGDIGYVLGPVLLGALVDHTTLGYSGALLVAAALLILIGAVFALMAQDHGR